MVVLHRRSMIFDFDPPLEGRKRGPITPTGDTAFLPPTLFPGIRPYVHIVQHSPTLIHAAVAANGSHDLRNNLLSLFHSLWPAAGPQMCTNWDLSLS